MFKFIFLLLAGCSLLIDLDDKGIELEGPRDKEDQLILAFSHNINGETHPCGCRQFPLGGLPQVAGQLNDLKKKGHLIYLDSGDLFFPTSSMVESVRKSLTFTANELVQTQQKLGLNFMLLGDQDFALGLPFLKEVSQKIPFLISNLKENKANQEQTPFTHRHWGKVEWKKSEIYFLGIIHPEVMSNTPYLDLLTSVQEGMERGLELIKNNGYDSQNPMHRLIVLSHSGTINDEELAKSYPQIDWIIGAHDMRFTQQAITVGKTKIVQVLSRNHYLGTINIDGKKTKNTDSFEMFELREEKANLLKPNPWVDYLTSYKGRLEKIQAEEQKELEKSLGPKNLFPHNTATSCIQCHNDQGKFWQQTSHANAYITLVNAQAQHNTNCITCHSLGFNDPQGFKTSHEIIRFDSEQKDLEKIRQSYWAHAFKNFPKKSIRKMTNKQRFEISSKWMKLDNEFNDHNSKVSYNFANVQCLNCHKQNGDHPFGNKRTLSKEQRKEEIVSRCLTCHTKDQSTEWYNGPLIKKEQLEIHYKKISCPTSKP